MFLWGGLWFSLVVLTINVLHDSLALLPDRSVLGRGSGDADLSVYCDSKAGWSQIPLPPALDPNVRGQPLEWPNSIVSSFRTPGILYVGGDTGVYVSESCGGQWRGFRINDGTGAGRHSQVSVLLVDVSENLYSSNYTDRLVMSGDGGLTWRPVTGDTGGHARAGALWALLSTASAADGGVVYANSYQKKDVRNPPPVGTWRSSNGGEWTLVDAASMQPSVLDIVQPRFRVVAVHPLDSRNVFAISREGIVLVSSDGTASFNPLGEHRLPTLLGEERTLDVEFGALGNVMWILTDSGRILMSRNDGATWALVLGPADGEQVVFMSANPFASDSFFAVSASESDRRLWIYRDAPSASFRFP
jgi:hypothetical protein